MVWLFRVVGVAKPDRRGMESTTPPRSRRERSHRRARAAWPGCRNVNAGRNGRSLRRASEDLGSTTAVVRHEDGRLEPNCVLYSGAFNVTVQDPVSGSAKSVVGRCCRKTILGAKARNIDSRSTTSAQHRINASFDRIRLLPTRDIAKTFSTASVRRVGLTSWPSRPVCPRHQTFLAPLGISLSCHERK